MIILAFETSCDETSVALVKDGTIVLANIVLSQIDIHQEFGGVIPELASRNHLKYITIVIERAIKNANIKISDIDYVAVTNRPGLIGCLIIGINAALSFSLAHNIPIIELDHIISHIYAASLTSQLPFPLLALVVSGGHTELILMKSHFYFEKLGQTLDDAVGEAYDKVGRLLNLPYPGGPKIDELALKGDLSAYKLPKPMIASEDLNFSFSGLKSAVLNLINNSKTKKIEIDIPNLCASFQDAVTSTLLSKIKNALKIYNIKTLVVAGGVAANKGLRYKLYNDLVDINIIIPDFKYCTDNATMVGVATYYKIKHTTFCQQNDFIIFPSSTSVLE